MKLSQGDHVVVISGKDKGKKGTVLRVLTGVDRVVISDVNLVTKHIKKTSQNAGRIIRFESSIPAGKVMILDPKTGKPTRVGYRRDEKTGKKVRYAKRSGTVLGRVKLEPKEKELKVSELREKPATPAGEKKAAPKVPVKSEKPVTTPKTPFWKKIGFGSQAVADAQRDEGSGRADSGPAPAGPTHTRSAGRGS